MTPELETLMIDIGLLRSSILEELSDVPDVQHVYEDELPVYLGDY